MIRLALLLLLVPANCFAAPPSWCVRVFCHKDNDGVVDYAGSGVLIKTDLVVTNYHVVANMKTFVVLFPDWESVEGTVVKFDKDVDLALIKIKDTHRKTVPVATSVAKGRMVKVYGYGQGIYKAGLGYVWAFAGTKTNQFCFFYVDDHQARPGDSGGPVVDLSGKLVGITRGQAPNMTLAVRFEEVQKLVTALKKEKKK